MLAYSSWAELMLTSPVACSLTSLSAMTLLAVMLMSLLEDMDICSPLMLLATCWLLYCSS